MAEQNQNFSKKQYGANQQNNNGNSNKKAEAPTSLAYNLLGIEPTNVTFIIQRKKLDSILEGIARSAFGEIAMAEFSIREDEDNVEFDPKSRTTRKKVVVEPIVWIDASNPNIAAAKDGNTLINVPVQQYSENYKKFVKAYCDDDCKNPYKDNITKRTREVNGRRYRAIRCSIPKIFGNLFDANGSAYYEEYGVNATEAEVAVYNVWSGNNHNNGSFKGLKVVKSSATSGNLKELLSGKQAFAPRGKKHKHDEDDED